MKPSQPLALLAALVCGLTACGGDEAPAAGGDDTLSGSLTVFAAASLTDVFTELGGRFESEHRNVEMTDYFNFGPSSGLATQINEGAPADVFASANTTQMEVAVAAGNAHGAPAVFVENVLEIAVPAGNPAGITGLADFANPDLTLAICAPEAPCGAAAQTVFQAAGITPSVDSLEEDVRAALTKVELGEVDAALVYVTDVTAAGGSVEGIEFPEAEEAVNSYPIVALAAAPNPDAARAWIEFVLSDVGAAAFEEAGFRIP
ncbi:MAG: molybdate ABC transporter substrate-binding protein [Actinomycetota bacterium]|nr:molybdate ABC transporter substrate-binding protein [Actinomycetota bacterium]